MGGITNPLLQQISATDKEYAEGMDKLLTMLQ
jgi:hypothetical protein